MIPPLVNCIVTDAVVKPNAEQALLQFVDVVQLQLVNSLPNDAPYLLVEQTKV